VAELDNLQAGLCICVVLLIQLSRHKAWRLRAGEGREEAKVTEKTKEREEQYFSVSQWTVSGRVWKGAMCSISSMNRNFARKKYKFPKCLNINI
jgi:hypothetical protein